MNRSRIAWLVLFASAMGWLEAVVVVYIRAIIGLAHGVAMPSAEDVMARLHALPWLLPTEQTREVATLAMLAAAAWLGGDRLRSRFGAFLMIFGVWDIVYYAGLLALVHWPTNLAAMDMLFLIPPHPWWYQPIWVPLLASCAMIGAGLKLFASRGAGSPHS